MDRAILEAVARADLILCWAWRIVKAALPTLPLFICIAVGKRMVRRDAR